MASWRQSLHIAALYIGTIVGAGFSTGQEIVQFFSRYGLWAIYGIAVTMLLFIWLGYKMMLLAAEINATSYEDLNKAIFGEQIGKVVSWFMIIVLLGVSSVMLAGAGAVFSEHWNLPLQLGLLLTAFTCFLILRKGLNAILAVNSIVVPIMLLFTFIIFYDALASDQSSRFLYLENQRPVWRALATPFLYAAFNLALAQAVLVPLGAKIRDAKTLKRGAILSGIGIAFMLGVAHVSLAAHLPELGKLAIPMAGIASGIGQTIYFIYIIIIFAEVFTTLLADVYGLALQIEQHSKLQMNVIIIAVLIICYLLSQIGFEELLSILYPLFGVISLGWLLLLVYKKTSPIPPTTIENAPKLQKHTNK